MKVIGLGAGWLSLATSALKLKHLHKRV